MTSSASTGRADLPTAGWWAAIRRRAPRTLHVTRAGKVVLAIAFATGFAAVNTGNNLLFLGWGMVLSAIVLSGVLSEATLRSVRAQARPPASARAALPCSIPVQLHNASAYLPSFGVEVALQLHAPCAETCRCEAPYQLRLEPATEHELRAPFVPPARGFYRVAAVQAATAYPFGFFRKSRHWRDEGVQFWAAPRRVEVGMLSMDLLSRLGAAPAQRVGPGEDFFSLRPYRQGDDLRLIHWRRSARTGRWVVRENEATAARQVLLELDLGGSATDDAARPTVEDAIASLGSLAEDLLAAGIGVGIRAPGTYIPPAGGSGHTWVILRALARLDPGATLPTAIVSPAVARIALVLPGAAAPAGADIVLPVPAAPPAAGEHA